MAQYPIKMLKDESGNPFVPLTQINAVVGDKYITTTFEATQVSTGHFVLTNDKVTEADLLGRVIAVTFPENVTATTNSYLKLNDNNEYLIKDEDGKGPLLIKDFANVVCFLMRKPTSWQLVKTGAAATSASSGHTILDNDGNVLPQQSVLQFKGFGVNDNPGTGATVISTPALVNNLTTSESNTGPLDAYQGKVLNDRIDSLSDELDNHTHGNLTTDFTTGTHINGNKGVAIINSTASPGSYTMLSKMNSAGGVFTLGTYQQHFGLYYTDNNTINAGENTFTKHAMLLDEAGNTSFPGNVAAATFNGYTLDAAASKKTRSANDITHSHWANVSTDSQYVPDMAFMAYWNGAHSAAGNSNLQYCDRGRFGTMATQSANDFERSYHWTAQTYGDNWCHICHIDRATEVEGMAGILHVTCTRGNVVGNATFLITASHSQQGYVTQLGSNTYSSFAIRAVANSSGSCYIDLYDNMGNASGTYQNWHCCFVPLRIGGITTYTSYTNGNTIPSGYRSDHHLQSWIGGGGAIQARHIAKQGHNVPASFFQSSQPTATQPGDIWFKI